MKLYSSLSVLCLALVMSVSGHSQPPAFLDLFIIEEFDYNNPIGTFTHSPSDSAYKVTSNNPSVIEPDISRALVAFLTILEPQKSYVIQHAVTYYFVFQYDAKDSRYLVMNNTINEKHEAKFFDDFLEAKGEMLLLLRGFYNLVPEVR